MVQGCATLRDLYNRCLVPLMQESRETGCLKGKHEGEISCFCVCVGKSTNGCMRNTTFVYEMFCCGAL